MGKIQIIGLGPGNEELITLSAYRLMRDADQLLLRTHIHPSVAFLDREHIAYEALDRFYEKGESFEEVYGHIVDYIIEKAADHDVVYAVPGSPVVAEKTVLMLEAQAPQAGISVEVLPGMSFLEVLYTELRMDPVNGVMILDSSDMDKLTARQDIPVVITQVYDKRIASDVKLSLMDLYGDEFEATLVYHISLPDELIRPIHLYELDRLDTIDHLTSLVLPAYSTQLDLPFDIEPLVEVMAELRSDHGCPWDKAQSHESLRRYLLEEVYEMLDAVDDGDSQGIREEMGDILYQVAFHCRLAEEKGLFSAQDVVRDVCNKMIRRHPYVFAKKTLENIGNSMLNWDRLKQGEQRQQHNNLLDGVVKGMPSLLEAFKLLEKASKVGFEWKDDAQVWDKVQEEWQEFKEALQENDPMHAEEEAGDVLFILANLFRRYHIESECALHRANSKFRRRFSYVENRVKESGRSWQEYTLPELEGLWQEAKKI